MNQHNLIRNAKDLRRKMTDAEELFWQYCRNRRIDGIKFRRQHPIGPYVLDFYWAKKKICIELDGGIHDDKEIRGNDEERTKKLEDHGVSVIRFTNAEVLKDIGDVFRKIVAFGESIPDAR